MPRLGPSGGATLDQRKFQRDEGKKRRADEQKESQRLWNHNHRHKADSGAVDDIQGTAAGQQGAAAAAAGPSSSSSAAATTPPTVPRPTTTDAVLSHWTVDSLGHYLYDNPGELRKAGLRVAFNPNDMSDASISVWDKSEMLGHLGWLSPEVARGLSVDDPTTLLEELGRSTPCTGIRNALHLEVLRDWENPALMGTSQFLTDQLR